MENFLAHPTPNVKSGITARRKEYLQQTHGIELFEAIKEGNVIGAIAALKAGANPNLPNPKQTWDKEPPLGLAARTGQDAIVRCLLECPEIKINLSYSLDIMKDESPVTPIFVALSSWKRDVKKRDVNLAKAQERLTRRLISKGAKMGDREKELLEELEEETSNEK